MRHIGIAGVTIPGSLLCIDTIVGESYRHFGSDTGRHPQITYTNPSWSEIGGPIVGKDWPTVARGLLDSMDILARAGAEFAVIPANAPHFAIGEVQERSPIPVISILDVTVEECERRGFGKVGVLGIGVTMSDGLYDGPLRGRGIEPVTLPGPEQGELNELLFSEVIHGKPDATTADRMRVFVERLKDRGCDGFIAACTEIPLVIEDEASSPLPFVDTTRLLARRAFLEAVSANPQGREARTG